MTLTSCAQDGDDDKKTVTVTETVEATPDAAQDTAPAADDAAATAGGTEDVVSTGGASADTTQSTGDAASSTGGADAAGDGADEALAEFSLPHPAGAKAVHLTEDKGGFRLDGSKVTFIFPSGSEFEFDTGAAIELEPYTGGSTYFSGPNGQLGITRDGEEITFSGASLDDGSVVVDLATGEGFVSARADGVKTSYKQLADGTYRCTTEEDGRSSSYEYYADGRPKQIQLKDTTVTFDEKGNASVIGEGWDPDKTVKSSSLGGGCAIDSDLVFVMEGDMLFDKNHHDLTSKSEPLIDELIYYLKNTGATKVRIVGHTDSDGSTEDNQALGQRRADAVGTYVTGILEDIEVETDSMGEESPIVANATDAGKAKNRRVEVTVLEKKKD